MSFSQNKILDSTEGEKRVEQRQKRQAKSSWELSIRVIRFGSCIIKYAEANMKQKARLIGSIRTVSHSSCAETQKKRNIGQIMRKPCERKEAEILEEAYM